MIMRLDGNREGGHRLLGAMFEARKRVFVDLLKWDVPVIDGRFEVDQFDDPRADYLVVTDSASRHLGSARLLETTRPHLLSDLFPSLCAGTIPTGPSIREITRFCLDPAAGATGRRRARDLLVSALVDHALEQGITTYTGVAEMGWFRQVIGFGWNCRPLGLPRKLGSSLLAALAIEISEDTPRLLAERGIYTSQKIHAPLRRAA